MADFNSLTTALEGWFDKPLADLPDEQQQRIRDDFFPMPWDSLNEDQRRSVAAQMDYWNDPATEDERERNWQLLSELDEIERQIAEWEAVATPTALDKAMRDDRLKMLREQRKAKKAEYWGTSDAPARAEASDGIPRVRPRRSTPVTEVAALVHSILTRRDRQSPSADTAFNYLLRGEYRSAQRGEEKELADWIVSTDTEKGIVKIVENGELSRDQFKRSFGTLADDKVR